MIIWNDHRKHRERLLIIAEMLYVAKEGALKTQIMYNANLSFSQVNKYIELLLSMQLLEKVTSDEKTVYKTAKKGFEYMKSFSEAIKLLNTDSKSPMLWQLHAHARTCHIF